MLSIYDLLVRRTPRLSPHLRRDIGLTDVADCAASRWQPPLKARWRG